MNTETINRLLDASNTDVVNGIREHIAKLEEALRFYADHKNHEEKLKPGCKCCPEYEPSAVFLDDGEIARKALEGNA